MTTRIWLQSKTDLAKLPGYVSILTDHAKTICGPDTVVDLHGVAPGTFPAGTSPNEAARYNWLGELTTQQIVENVMRAEREGYDAFAMSCFGDPGVHEARSLVDIPVIGSFESSFKIATITGQAIGVLSLNAAGVRRSHERIRAFGFQHTVAAVMAMDPPMNEYELDAAFKGSPTFLELFSVQAARLVAAGADVIIPAEGVINTLLVRNGIREIDGTPIFDSYGSVLAFAEMLVQLRRKSGLAVARRGIYARPPAELLRHVRGVTIEALRAAQDETAAAARKDN